MIPHEYIEELVRRSDVVDVVGSYVQLKRKGRLYAGLCPFHNEKTPSFYVYRFLANTTMGEALHRRNF